MQTLQEGLCMLSRDSMLLHSDQFRSVMFENGVIDAKGEFKVHD
jgi:hypothetical protein